MDHLCYLCLLFVMLLRLVVACGEALASWLLFVVFIHSLTANIESTLS